MTDWEPRSRNSDMFETYWEGNFVFRRFILQLWFVCCSFLTCSHLSQKIPHFDTDSALIGVFLVGLETSEHDKRINISIIKLTLKYVFFSENYTLQIVLDRGQIQEDCLEAKENLIYQKIWQSLCQTKLNLICALN